MHGGTGKVQKKWRGRWNGDFSVEVRSELRELAHGLPDDPRVAANLSCPLSTAMGQWVDDVDESTDYHTRRRCLDM
ncbi:hypothetical protein CTAM01_01592 [Colletotrichum tamarilloi]|uniref:Uncharacterized protein n=1 Tax=Colletotrichum tamarilloi TaxID=1209934 RepID=A0ABQ9RSF8_9PEZI|nr:uncharacterized protein CTAM01_01592 [Colletotrichum tamarilloi]KAK1511019.1 hypothetical protein CTAM01_01592 [Colletotrichum tamarilloi]